MNKPCRLCGLSKPLLKSHILPEFVYRPAYDATHTAIIVDLGKRNIGKQQKGFSERLLCKECEGIFSIWENYFSRIWFHPRYRLRPKYLNDNLIEIRGIDYSSFKLFHLSLVWRASVSARTEFSSVALGSQEEVIRKILLSRDPGEHDKYAFFGIALRIPSTQAFQDKLLCAPRAARVQGHNVYTFLFGGVVWHYIISGHIDEYKRNQNNFNRSGTLFLAVQNWKDNPLVRDLLIRAQSIPKP